MELKQLNYFLRVAEQLNFSRAAETLYISQPALSYQIAELERELGCELFTRDRRKVYLTSAGMALVEPAKAMLEQAGNLPVLVQQSSQQESGALRIGFDSTEDHFEQLGITESIARFSEENPGVKLTMMRGPFTECADRVIYGELDLAFLILRHKERLPPDLTARLLFSSKLVMAVRKDCPVETCAEAVKTMELILVDEKPRGNSRILKAMENMKLTPKVRRVDSFPAGFVYAQMGKGIMLLSEVYYNQHLYKDMKRIDIPDDASTIWHAAVWNRNTTNPMVNRLLVKLPEYIQEE